MQNHMGVDFVDRYESTGTNTEKIAAMRNIPADSLVMSIESPIQGGLVKSEWHPALDGVVFTDLPMNIAQSGNQNKVPVIIGSNADEMSVSAPLVVTPAMLNLLIQTLIPAQYRSQVLALYPPGETNEQAWESYVGILTDLQFTLPVRRTAQCLSLNQEEPVWRYFLTYRHPISQLEKYGSYHGMELLYLFNNWENTLLGSFYFQPQDDSLQNVLLNYWVNFARTGNPNGDGLENWPQYSASGDCYLEINATPDGSNCGIRKEKLDLWEEIAGIPGCVSTNSPIESNKENDIQIFPNPATNEVYYFCSENENLKIRVLNSMGQMLEVPVSQNKIDISGLKAGWYFVQFQTGKGIITKKLIKED